MSDHIGAGWAFPLGTNRRGGISLASGVAKVEQSMQIILRTRIGERVMRPTFGCRLHELVFAPFDAETLGLAERYVTEALNFWEPRIDVLETRAEPDQKSPQDSLSITILYRIKETNDERNLVYPFYRVPGEPRTDR